MTDQIRIPKNLALWISIGTLAVAFIANTVLTRDKVERHEKLLNEYNIPVMNEKMDNMAEDIDEIKGGVKELVRAINDMKTR